MISVSAAVVLFIFNIHETNGKDSSFLLQFNIPSYSNTQKVIAFKRLWKAEDSSVDKMLAFKAQKPEFNP